MATTTKLTTTTLTCLPTNKLTKLTNQPNNRTTKKQSTIHAINQPTNQTTNQKTTYQRTNQTNWNRRLLLLEAISIWKWASTSLKRWIFNFITLLGVDLLFATFCSKSWCSLWQPMKFAFDFGIPFMLENCVATFCIQFFLKGTDHSKILKIIQNKLQ